LEQLNSDIAAEFIQSELIPKLYAQYSNEIESEFCMSQQDFMYWLKVSMVDTSTAFHWLKDLGFCFDTKRNSSRAISILNFACIVGYRFQLIMQNIFESETDSTGNHLMMGMWACEFKNKTGTLMQEYHVDCHLEFFHSKYVTLDDCKKLGRNLSVQIPDGTCLKMLIGQDECIIKEICSL